MNFTFAAIWIQSIFLAFELAGLRRVSRALLHPSANADQVKNTLTNFYLSDTAFDCLVRSSFRFPESSKRRLGEE